MPGPSRTVRSAGIISLVLTYIAIPMLYKRWAFRHRPTVLELQRDPIAVHRRYSQHRPIRWRTSSLTDNTDTPLASLYRLYEFLVVDWTVAFRNEIEYFSGQHTWAVKDIPDPRDPDPLRYAILAVLTCLLCKAFNRNIAQGLPRDTPPIDYDWEEVSARPKVFEQVPEWAQRVPRVRKKGEWYILMNEDGFPREGDADISDDFKSVGILARQPHYLFV